MLTKLIQQNRLLNASNDILATPKFKYLANKLKTRLEDAITPHIKKVNKQIEKFKKNYDRIRDTTKAVDIGPFSPDIELESLDEKTGDFCIHVQLDANDTVYATAGILESHKNDIIKAVLMECKKSATRLNVVPRNVLWDRRYYTYFSMRVRGRLNP